MFTIAEMLGKTLDEVMDISVDEYNGWRAYLKIKAADAKHVAAVNKHRRHR